MHDLLPYILLFGDTHDLVGAVLIYNEYVVEVRAVEEEFVILQRSAYEASGLVEIEAFVGLSVRRGNASPYFSLRWRNQAMV